MIFKILALVSPFVASGLTYFFAIRIKKKEIDLEKVKELNTVLSNLLNVWYYLKRLKSLANLLGDKENSSIIPLKYLSAIALQNGVLNEGCFNELESSILLLKKYAPITYFKIEGVGRNIEQVRVNFLLPVIKNTTALPEELLDITEQNLTEIIGDIEDHLSTIGEQLGNKTVKDIMGFLKYHGDEGLSQTIDELNLRYYETMKPMVPSGTSFTEFKELTKTAEYQEIIGIQMKIVQQGLLQEFFDMMSDNPDVSIEEINEMLNP